MVGDVILDHYLWGDATRISPEAPVPIVHVERDTYVAGGAANVALNLCALGAQAEICGWVGKDTQGERVREILDAAGATLNEDFWSTHHATITKTRVMCREQQLCRLDRECPPGDYRIPNALMKSMILDRLSEFDAVIISDYAKGTITTEALRVVCDEAEKAQLIAIDPKPRRTIDYTGAGLITPNRSESLQLAGFDNDDFGDFPAEAVCKRIYERFKPALLAVTLGRDGMLISRKGIIERRIPTAARDVFDVSGAGDTVIASMTLALCAGADAQAAAELANTAAGVVVGKLGTATATAAEVLTHLDRHDAE